MYYTEDFESESDSEVVFDSDADPDYVLSEDSDSDSSSDRNARIFTYRTSARLGLSDSECDSEESVRDRAGFVSIQWGRPRYT